MPGIALFSTPLFVLRPPELASLCAEVTALLLTERDYVDSRVVSNYGGSWHSAPDLARRTEPIWQTLAQAFVAGVREAFTEVAASQGQDVRGMALEAGVQMWGMVMPTGGYATLHEHHDASWSAVFYADCGDPGEPPAGALAIVDPRRVPATCAGVTLYPSSFTIRPENGMMVVFPGWLQHYVHAYDGTRPRVSVAANVTFKRR